MSEQWLGLITGVAFGALLQQGRVLRFEKQVGALLLKDMTIMKFMLSAILVGMVGINLLAGFGLVKLSPKATVLGVGPWPVIAVLAVIYILAFLFFEKKGVSQKQLMDS
jgi:hypothetical protein